MTKLARNALRFALAATAGTVCLFINDNMSTVQWSSLITQADARMSVAGERRRHARRAVRRSYAARYGAGGYYGPYGGYLGYPSAYYGAYAAYPGAYPVYPGGYYGAYGRYPYGAYYGGYANRSYVTGRRTLIPRYYGAYAAAYPGGYYGVYPALADRSYGAYGSYANRSYVTGRRTLIPRYYGY